ncbi:50S ribosomal protein L24 [Patescibacteria group bacterium]|nr:50S ribosomal protein L24 [Patescibacteria group bacterium]
MKIKMNDNVKVIAGKDRGKSGKVTRTLNKNEKIIVEKLNMRTKHIKKTTTNPGSKITFEAAMPVSNVMVVCPSCKKTTRIGYKKLETGKKERICKKCKESLDKATAKK